MTEFLFGNYLNWCQSTDGFRTTNTGTRPVKTYTPDIFRRIPVLPQPNPDKDDMILMNFGGKFVGMIVNVRFNNATINGSTEFEFIKTTGLGTTVVNTGVKIVIPGSAPPQPLGLFYSNTDIAEFTRTWEPLEFIGIKVSKLVDTQNLGISGCTLMICMDLELPPPVIPP